MRVSRCCFRSQPSLATPWARPAVSHRLAALRFSRVRFGIRIHRAHPRIERRRSQVNAADLDRAIARIPRWIIVLGLLGTGFAGRMGGAPYAGPFLVGAAAAWLNFGALRDTSREGHRRVDVHPVRGRRSGGLCYTQVFRFQSGCRVFWVPRVSGRRDRRNRLRTTDIWSLMKPG